MRRLADGLFGVHLIDAWSEVLGPFEPLADRAALPELIEGLRRPLVGRLADFCLPHRSATYRSRSEPLRLARRAEFRPRCARAQARKIARSDPPGEVHSECDAPSIVWSLRLSAD